MASTLAVSHNLFLTGEERDNLLKPDGTITTIGVSVPVWFCKGLTSEPAVEVYAKYTLFNKKEIIYIKHNDEGYEITMPPFSAEIEKLPNDVWNSLSSEAQEQWWAQHEPGPSLMSLKNIKDGGSEWFAFRQHSKIKRNKKTLNIIHYVEIKLMQELKDSLS